MIVVRRGVLLLLLVLAKANYLSGAAEIASAGHHGDLLHALEV